MRFFYLVLICLDFYFLLKCLRLLVKFTEVTTEHQKLPKTSKNSMKGLSRSPLQELEVGPRSGPYLLLLSVHYKVNTALYIVKLALCITMHNIKYKHCTVKYTLHCALTYLKGFHKPERRRKKRGRSPSHELEVGPRSGPYLLLLSMHCTLQSYHCTVHYKVSTLYYKA